MRRLFRRQIRKALAEDVPPILQEAKQKLGITDRDDIITNLYGAGITKCGCRQLVAFEIIHFKKRHV